MRPAHHRERRRAGWIRVSLSSRYPAAMELDREAVLHIAKLARIALTDDEIEMFRSSCPRSSATSTC